MSKSKTVFDFALSEMDTAIELLRCLKQYAGELTAENLSKEGVCSEAFLNAQANFASVANTLNLMHVVRKAQAEGGG